MSWSYSPQPSSLTLCLETFPWKPLGSWGLLSTSCLDSLLGACNKLCTFLHHSPVSVNCLYCMQAKSILVWEHLKLMYSIAFFIFVLYRNRVKRILSKFCDSFPIFAQNGVFKIYVINKWVAHILKVSSLLLGEGNGTPLQYSCLENPMDGGTW